MKSFKLQFYNVFLSRPNCGRPTRKVLNFFEILSDLNQAVPTTISNHLADTQRHVMAEGSKFDAPAVYDDKAIREEKKKCVTCGIEVDYHLGPTGPGRCFGKALTGCFENLLHTVCAMQKTILEEREEAKKEREEAKDREKRLSIKVSKLSLSNWKKELLDKALEKMESLEKSLALTKTAGTGVIDPGKKAIKKKKTQEQRNKKLTERSWVDDGSNSSSEDDKHANGQGKHGEVEKESSLRVKRLLKDLVPTKAPGPDDITPSELKMVADKIA